MVLIPIADTGVPEGGFWVSCIIIDDQNMFITQLRVFCEDDILFFELGQIFCFYGKRVNAIAQSTYLTTQSN
jgi:hypothetical protein